MLTHLDTNGNATMVDISNKKTTTRTALASGVIHITPEILEAIKKDSIKKGNVFTVAKIAGINSAKMTESIIPLCHQIPLDYIDINFDLQEENLIIEVLASVKTSHKTGVEMEALVAVNASLLTVYDMCKGVSKDMQITDIKLLKKTGGKSGDWETSSK
ncbi:cyclic pyranopterin monophosphate synthase MoaC [Methylophilaceae bacterium]|jgi:cyclic pyranopterin phosphate synthase|nr:cyclic pyranopterin monophosphate synthase MoaC [Methylophilaceae bacterium]